MIVIIDEKTDKVYHTKFKTRAAKKIGVHRNTIARWIDCGRIYEKYNRYKIYLESYEA